jgi:hypothetical protein
VIRDDHSNNARSHPEAGPAADVPKRSAATHAMQFSGLPVCDENAQRPGSAYLPIFAHLNGCFVTAPRCNFPVFSIERLTWVSADAL